MPCVQPAASAPENQAGTSVGVVHDLGNLIQIAASALNIIGRSGQVGGDAALEPILTRGKTALGRAAALVRQTMAGEGEIAPGVGATPERLSVRSCLSEIQPLITWVCDPDITLAIDVAPGLPSVDCNRVDLQSAILNLVINARDAMPYGGSILICARHAEGPGPAFLELSVADDGAGMAPDTLQRAFEPHFTTKAQGQGVGLGLAMVRRFARQAGGEAQIASVLGRGSTVTLHLPTREGPCP